MQTADLRIDAGWIVPIEPAGALRDHALVISAGRIAALLPIAEADQSIEARERIVLRDHVLLPGLVNAHTHAAMTLFRGLADDVPLKLWLEREIWPREGRFVTPEFVYDGARLAAAEMLLGGVTCFNDMYFFPDATARASVELGTRAMLGLPILDFPTAYAADADGYLTAGLAIRDAWKHEPCLTFSLAPHAPLHGKRCDVEEDRRVRPPARLADPDASRRDRRRDRREHRAARARAPRSAACARSHGAGLHCDPWRPLEC
jgi:5-methylthioadenosine/S-adenosylhomocysteine deaminase